MTAHRKNLHYLPLSDIEPDSLLAILNHPHTRTHLIPHPQFNRETLVLWMADKLAIDALPGYRVRAVLRNHTLIGWCGIQPQGHDAELAIVIDHSAWGSGKTIIIDMMDWAKTLGHKRVIIQLLKTRKNYAFLQRLAVGVSDVEWQGHHFTRYELSVV